ncbi:MAG: fibro-slime domain-containing protein [Nannocystaceae bacterium]|nr:fibro-slime domain-containing protein [Myxococcales bacterium]
MNMLRDGIGSIGLATLLALATGCGDSDALSESASDSGTAASDSDSDSTSDSESSSESGSESDGSTTAGTDSGTSDSSTSDSATSDTSDSDDTTLTSDATMTTDDTVGTTTDPSDTDTTTDPSDTDTTTDPTDTDATTDPTDTDTDTDTEGMIECGNLPVTYRDFMPLHVDFGCHMFGNAARPGLVLDQLGNDNKPVYNPNPPPPPGNWNGSNPQITSQASFAEWYNPVPDVNIEIQGEIALMEIMPGVWSFQSNSFYPLTDMGWGNNVTPNWAGETYPDRNGAFTTEIHTNFVYTPGQSFTFIGDDDVWVFIDGQLALDIGGLHSQVSDTVNLDTLGLTPNQMYSLDVFHAERCGSGSNFRIDTSIQCFVPQ